MDGAEVEGHHLVMQTNAARRRAQMATAVVSLVALAGVAVIPACEDDDGASTATTTTEKLSPEALPTFWVLAEGAPPVPSDATEFDAQFEAGGCIVDGEPLPGRKLSRLDVDESDDRVTVTLWVELIVDSGIPTDANFVCSGMGMHADARVRLSEPLGSRAIVDGFCDTDGSPPVGPLKCVEGVETIQAST